MTGKELQTVLLIHYIFVVEAVKDLPEEEVDQFLFDTDTNFGVCHCARVGFGDYGAYSRKWIKAHCPPNRDKWAYYPWGEEKKEAIRLLEKRIDILKTITKWT
jgi:hypothetical protein